MNAIELLRNKGLKKTTQRILFLSILQKSPMALTEDEIKQEMGDLYDRITFYRTIQVLIDADIIHRITIDNKTIKYALNETCTHGENHIHFFCKKCHTVTCIKDELSVEYSLPKGYERDECEVLIKGTCKDCKTSSK